jgi:hypothetical protein
MSSRYLPTDTGTHMSGKRVSQELTGGSDHPVCFHHLKASITKCFTA